MENKVTITVEELQKLAEKNPFYKGVLRKVFPEVDLGQEKKPDVHFNLGVLRRPHRGDEECNIFVGEETKKAGLHEGFMQISDVPPYRDKGFYLSPAYNWKMRKDNAGNRVLIPTKKLSKKKK